MPGDEFVAGQARFVECRQIWIRRRALQAGNAQRAQLAGDDVLTGLRDARYHHLDIACQRGEQRRSAALVMHRDDVGLPQIVHQLAADVRIGRGASRGEVEAAGLGTRQVEKLFQGARRHLGIDHHHRLRVTQQRDRHEVVERVVVELRVQMAVGDERIGVDEQGVAIGAGARRLLHADIPRGAAAVLHQDLLAERVGEARCEQARDGVDASAGRKRHDHADRLVRIGLRQRRMRSAHGQGEGDHACAVAQQ